MDLVPESPGEVFSFLSGIRVSNIDDPDLYCAQ